MIFEQCEAQIGHLFAAHARNLQPKTLDAWYEELRRYEENDLVEAVRILRTADKLPTLGEVKRATKAAASRAQWLAEAQAHHAEQAEDEGATMPFGRAMMSVVLRLGGRKLDYARAVKYLSILVRRYRIQSPLPLSGDLADDHELAAEYKRLRWRQDLGQLAGLRKVTDKRFEVRL